MKIKHFSGYGLVNAKKVDCDKNSLVIEVSGVHEKGIDTDDKQIIHNWLVKRFDKSHKDWMDIEDVYVFDEFVKEDSNNPWDIFQRATYDIRFRDKNDYQFN